ncbi:MAG: trypsin-like peptidase domain-containing protein [Candidatus Brocadiia bacterium]
MANFVQCKCGEKIATVRFRKADSVVCRSCGLIVYADGHTATKTAVIERRKPVAKKVRPSGFKPRLVMPAQFLGLAPIFYLNLVLAIVAVVVLIAYGGSRQVVSDSKPRPYSNKLNEWTQQESTINARIKEAATVKVNVKSIINDIMLNEVPASYKKTVGSTVIIEPQSYRIVNGERRSIGYGRPSSGFVFSPSGSVSGEDFYIITTFAAVDMADYVTVTFSDMSVARGSIAGGDPDSNIGVVRVPKKFLANAEEYRAVPTTDNVSLGEPIQTLGGIGMNTGLSLYRGAISFLKRARQSRLASGRPSGKCSVFYQTNCVINPGMEGGPAFNARGEIIGVSMSYLSEDDLGAELGISYEYVNGVNLILPIGYALKIANAIVKDGYFKRATIGVEFEVLDPADPASSLVVSYVEPESPAGKAGIVPGDRVLTIGATPIEVRVSGDIPALYRTIADLKTDAKIALKLQHAGAERTAELTPIEATDPQDFEFYCEDWGLSLRILTPREAAKRGLGETRGLFVSSIDRGGRAAEVNLRIGDIIVSIEGKLPVNRAELEELYIQLTSDQTLRNVFFKVIRSGYTRLFLLRNVKKISSGANVN